MKFLYFFARSDLSDWERSSSRWKTSRSAAATDRLTTRRNDAAADECLLIWTRNSAVPSTYLICYSGRFLTIFSGLRKLQDHEQRKHSGLQRLPFTWWWVFGHNSFSIFDIIFSTFLFRSRRPRIRIPGTTRTAQNLPKRTPRLNTSPSSTKKSTSYRAPKVPVAVQNLTPWLPPEANLFRVFFRSFIFCAFKTDFFKTKHSPL